MTPKKHSPALCFLLFLFSILPAALCQDKNAEVEALGRAYLAAIQTGSEENILAIFYPGTFDVGTPEEAAWQKKKWLAQLKMHTPILRQPMIIKVTRLGEKSNPLPNARWAATPEYQIQIELANKPPLPPDQETRRPNLPYVLTEAVASKDGRFYILRPLPPADTLKKMMEKETAAAGN